MTYIPEILPPCARSRRSATRHCLQRKESAPRRNCHGVRAIFGAELAHDVLQMDLDGFLGDEEFLSDLPVAIPVSDPAENLDFALAEIVFTQIFDELGSDFPRNTLAAGMNPPNRFENAMRRRALQQVPISPCLECPPYLDVLLKCRQDDDSGIGELGSDPNENFDSAYVGEVKVQQRDIRSGSTVCFNALPARSGGRYLRYTLLVGNNCSDALSKYGVRGDTQDPHCRIVRRGRAMKSPGETARMNGAHPGRSASDQGRLAE